MKNKNKYKNNFCSLDALLADTEMYKTESKSGQKTKGEKKKKKSITLNNALRIQGAIFFFKEK